MSRNDGRSRRRVDEVPREPPSPSVPDSFQSFQDSELQLAVSADPLPPPPLPAQPPFGPAFPSGDAEEPEPAPAPPELKPVRRFIPDSWKDFFRGKRAAPGLGYISAGVECSPPSSPAPSGSGREARAAAERGAGASSAYREQVERYHLRYAYMKSWAGLLRLLGAVQLLLGAAVFACVTAYVHKDSEWYNLFGLALPYAAPGLGGAYGGGYQYSGPRTPFVLVAAGLAWIATLIVLVLGLSLYYRTILLDSDWWPLTEFAINVALFVLYMAAAVVYVNDTNRGGLCYYPVLNMPLNAGLCRVESGQVAAMIFLFATMLTYLVSALVSLKLWRHEAARRHRERAEQAEICESSVPLKRRTCEMVTSDRQRDPEVYFKQWRTKSIPPGHIPKPIVMPDYVAKYPVIQTDDERERYKAVFQDQFSEYKELSADVHAVLRKLDKLDAMMSRLPHRSENLQEHERISRIHEEFRRKKNDPSFLEKKERCDYLKSKLSHIKQRIQDYDKTLW
ncbi:PREDICTED: MARVEL domain-containing protein 2 isoform X2 [Chinchilla lanigera]|uniref:MARVEL domain containing 2 n=1 Tax=Chinchilla lanigera TaxID=34839 RepID=A0A8C2UN40_CHILA|nr:PREDICTED: MARVEL domain-containing protein 2 isoform X2 [Chinchilla lanigera]